MSAPIYPQAERIPPSLARRVAIAASGLHRRAHFGRGRSAGLRALEHIGYAQIDTISVVRRAHEHVLLSRAPGFATHDLDKLVAGRKAFEYWAHAASFLPMRDFRQSLPRMERLRAGGTHWRRSDPKTMRRVMDRVRAEGPLSSRDFEEDASIPIGGGAWGSMKPAKAALDRLFHEGQLMVSGRSGFAKTYDLTERVLPAGVDTRTPDLDEHAAFLVDTARRALGIFAPRHVTHLRREPGIGAAVKQAIAADCEAGRLTPVVLAGEVASPTRTLFADTAAMNAPARITRSVRALSPFDNLLIHRDRMQRLFDFDYTLECYVTEAKRQFGYFVLPLLEGARFIGRLDCKAHRRQGNKRPAQFEIRHLYIEPGHDQAVQSLAESVVEGIAPLAAQDACEGLTVSRISGVCRSTAAALGKSLAAAWEAQPR